jgi:O-antigen ligase
MSSPLGSVAGSILKPRTSSCTQLDTYRVTALSLIPERIREDWLLLLIAASAALLGLGSVAAPITVTAALLGLMFVAISARSLAAGLALFTLLVFFTRIPALSSSGLTFVKLAGAVLAGSWLLRVASRESRLPFLPRDHPALAFAALLFLGWTSASMLWASDVGSASSSSFALAQSLLLFFIVFSAIERRRHLWWFLCAFVGGATLSGLIGLVGYTSPERYPLSPERLTGGIRDANELAAILVPALAFALFGVVATRSPLLRWMLGSCAAISALALFRTDSRGGLVALTVTFVAALMLAGPVRVRVASLMALTMGAGILYYTTFAPPEALARVTRVEEGGGSGRTDIWAIALDVWHHHPIFGVGTGNFRVIEPAYALGDVSIQRLDLIVDRALVVHNTYLQFLTEIGLIGFGLFATLVLAAFVIAGRAVGSFSRSRDLEMELLSRGLIIGAIGMFAGFFFISAQYLKQLPLLLGALVALSSIARTSRSGPEPMESSRTGML